MPKATTLAAEARIDRRHKPLEDDLLATGPLRTKPPKRKNHSQDGDKESYVDSKSSRKILRIGLELADEEEESRAISKSNSVFEFGSRFNDAEDKEDAYDDDDGAWGDDDEIAEEAELAPEDLETFSKFFPTNDDPFLRQGWGETEKERREEQGTSLADLILEKIAAHEATQADTNGAAQTRGVAPVDDYELPPKVVEVYSKIGLLLSRYKSGKLPKPFKILPTVPHWETIIAITRPESWTPNACYEASRIFISSTPLVAQRFIESIILGRVREDIYETKKLNVHLFNALKKGLYKPAAWFKGFLFPLVISGTCTLREAHIVSGVLARVSIPVLHSAAALKGLCDIAAEESSAGTEGGGATNIFIKTLLEKKYALPYQVIDALVFHFLRFRTVLLDEDGIMAGAANGSSRGGDARTAAATKEMKLPVIWHQSLLAFAQRYRNDITEDQREALLDLLLTKGHSAIGPEVRRELLEGRGRGIVTEPEGPGNGGDDTMMLD